MNSFWYKLMRPIVGLSPMDGVTDAAFRYMTAKYGKPDVMFTEFVNVEGMSRVAGERVNHFFAPFIYGEPERPVVAQVFGKTPEMFYQVAVVVATLGFDGMDINMGCPAKNVASKGSGAGLIGTELALRIVNEAKRGMKDWSEGKVGLDDLEMSDEARGWVEQRKVKRGKQMLPVSVKTRIGVSKDVVDTWIEQLMTVKPAVVSLHGRTLRQLYAGEADWESIARAAEIVHRNEGVILGNGDVKSVEEAKMKALKYGVDGVLVGRAAFGNPGVFAGSQPDQVQRLSWLVEHSDKYEELFGRAHFAPMRKHLAWYCREFEGAAELRGRLMKAESAQQVKQLLKRDFLPPALGGQLLP